MTHPSHMCMHVYVYIITYLGTLLHYQTGIDVPLS